MSAPHYRFAKVDRITIRGIPRRWINTCGASHVFEHLDAPEVHETFTNDQLVAETLRQDWGFDPGALSEARAHARMFSGVPSFENIPARELPVIHWRHEFCRTFEEFAVEGRVKRTDEATDEAMGALQAEVLRRVVDKLPRSPTGREARGGAELHVFKTPKARQLRRWVKRLKDADGNPAALRRGWNRCGNRTDRFEPEVEALLDQHASEYADESRPPRSVCYGNLVGDILKLNKEREAAGDAALACPSAKAFATHVKQLDAFEVYAARHGTKAATRKFQVLGNGLDLERAGERIEMDEWEVHLQTLLVKLKVWRTLSEEQREAVARVRVWICFAIDAMSRCILGFNVSRTATAENAIAGFQMVLRDKRAYAEAVGAKSPWDMACTPEAVVTDAGSSFIADDFKSKLVSVLASPHTAVAGVPKLRARIERLLGTIDQGVLAHMIGRTFSNPVDKGDDYDPAKRAAMTVEAFCEALCLWIIDVYHNKPHRGLNNATPANTWRKLASDFGVCPPPGPNKLRHVFGLDARKVTGPHGVLVLGLNYRSDALHQHRLRRGETVVDVKVDPLDLGHVSVRLDDKWHTCPCRTPNMSGVSIAEWTDAMADLRRRNLIDARPTLSIMHDAISSIRAAAKQGIEDFGLGLTKPSAETLARAEAELFIGVSMPIPDDDAPEGPVAKPDLLAGAIEGTGPLSPTWLSEHGIDADPVAPGPSCTDAGRPDPQAAATTEAEPAVPGRPLTDAGQPIRPGTKTTEVKQDRSARSPRSEPKDADDGETWSFEHD